MMRIVIVEDHQMIREILVMALKGGAGHHVSGFDTAAGGIAACLDGADLAVFDHRLPDMTGTQAIEQLRTDPRTEHMPIIVVTGEHDSETRMNAIRAGATEFLTKPVNIDEFRLRVRNLLALEQARKTASDRGNLLETLIAESDARIAVADAGAALPTVRYVSRALQEMQGLDVSDIAVHGDAFLGLQAEDSDQLGLLRDAIGKREAGRFVVRATPRQALPFWNAVKLQPVPAAGADARFLVISHQNISDIVEMRADLNRVEGRLSAIANISGAWFFELDADLCLTYVSVGMARAFSVRPEDILGRHIDRLGVRLQDPARRDMALAALLRDHDAPQRNELLSFRLPDGSKRAVQVSMVPFRDDAGQFAGYRGYAGDVSALAEARDLAQRASRAKSAFLATMSHEMRTPLTAILGMADVLQQGGASPQQQEHLRMIAAAATDLTGVLGDVLDVARLEDGPLSLGSAPFDPVAAWNSVTAQHAQAARQKGLAMHASVKGTGTGQRLGDAPRVEQLLRHLLSNAVKFTDTGQVTAELDLSDREGIVIRITDTGIGMAEDQIARAFEPFCQLDDGIARRFGGSGVGLSIARWLALSMGGSLDLSSARDQGTSALLKLPLRLAEPVASGARAFETLQGVAVLVADDSAANRRLLELMLKGMQANVTLCDDGDHALDAWQNGAFDLLLLDINMPRMAGTDLVREIRRLEAEAGKPPVPALAVTANAMPDQVREYIAAGFDGCVGKPFTSGNLRKALAEIA